MGWPLWPFPVRPVRGCPPPPRLPSKAGMSFSGRTGQCALIPALPVGMSAMADLENPRSFSALTEAFARAPRQFQARPITWVGSGSPPSPEVTTPPSRIWLVISSPLYLFTFDDAACSRSSWSPTTVTSATIALGPFLATMSGMTVRVGRFSQPGRGWYPPYSNHLDVCFACDTEASRVPDPVVCQPMRGAEGCWAPSIYAMVELFSLIPLHLLPCWSGQWRATQVHFPYHG